MINNDLHWLAFRYVAGEMTAAEEEHFEQRLADEQGLREAVEQAVELNEAIRLVHAEPVPISSRRNRFLLRRPAIWAAGLAASLFLAFGLIWSVYHTSQRPGVSGNGNEFSNASSATDSEVARAWVELRDRADNEASQPAQPEVVVESELEMEDVMETEVRVPPWMLAAFSEQDKRNR
jgi:hypothetical protein